MNEDKVLFQIFKDLWQIVKKYPDDVPITEENARDFTDMLTAFTGKYNDTAYYSLAVGLALAYGDFKNG